METKYSNQLNSLINDLKNQNFLTNPLVLDILNSNRISEKDIAPYEYYDHAPNESYGRRLIFDNGNFKILLMSWSSGDFTAIHNHGYTEWGCVYFFGDATHRLYDTTNEELKIIQQDNYHNGQIASVCGDLTHIMGNLSSKNFSTLHIYGSNTRRNEVSKNASVYLPEFEKEVTTMGSAYLNMDKQLILSEKPMIAVGNDVLSDYLMMVKPFYERNGLLSVLKNLEKRLENGTINEPIT